MKKNQLSELREFLDLKVAEFNTPAFIEHDPISIPHLFTAKEDREISGFLIATIAWGQRPTILKNGLQLMKAMDYQPSDFIRHHSIAERKQFAAFVHRTFNGTDCIYFIKALQQLYRHHDGLEGSFSACFSNSNDLGKSISEWKNKFFAFQPETRTFKHFADPLKNSSAKRICMYLRWMVRKDNAGVDFGIWKKIPVSALCPPLDLHSGRVARLLGLLERKQDDWKAVTELRKKLLQLDPNDPVKYDFALYGLGIYEGFK
ncbi:TIGR02757 family protein [soil metagenome]